MPHILATKYRPEARNVIGHDADGNETESSELAQLVHEVTFYDYMGIPHTLTFHPKGTIVSTDSEPFVRTVGDNVPYYEYEDANQAAQDYLDGKVQ